MKNDSLNKGWKTGTALGLLLGAMIPPIGAAPASTQQSVERWLGDQPGGVAVAYVDASGVTFFNAGKFDMADQRPMTPDTEFEIGSMTKVFTALLLADTVRAGKVALDTPVGAPFERSAITWQQLATHTSGLPRLPGDFRPGDPANPYADQDLARLEQSFRREAPKAKPSERMDYSNFGYAVLGQALAGAWGQPYRAVLKERILGPLGLKDTVTTWRKADPARLAPGHAEQGRAANWDLDAYAPAGALVSTTRDLARFVQACLGFVDTPLAPVLAEVTKPRAMGDMPGRQIGLGWLVEKRGESTIVWHNGGTGGYRAFVGFDPAKRVGVVALTNHTRGTEPLGFALLAGVELPKPKAPEAPANSLRTYLGNYPLTPSFVIAITAEGDKLYAQATNQPRLALQAVAGDRYAIVGVAAEISFERNATGEVTALILHQNGLNQRAPHLAPGAMPSEAKSIALTAEQLADYPGEYQLGPVMFTVKIEGGQLVVQLTGQAFYPVFASAKDEFFYKIVNAQLSFVRGADGKVVALILHQNGRDQWAEKRRG